jgi:hypothetical protein
VWFRRGRLLIVSPDSLGTACPLSGRNSTYRPVQISDFTRPCVIGYGASPSRCGPARLSAGQTRELPVPAKEAYHAGLPRALALACSIILPSVISTASAPRIFLSRLNGWPVPSPTDASALASRPPMHGSGTMRFATPSSCRTFTDYFSPVSRRTEIRTPAPQMRSASGVE